MSFSVLIVEDQKNLGSTLKEYLEVKDYNVSLASTADEARRVFLSKNFDIVLMDIGLPDGDGLEVAKEFRSIRKNFALIFLSALNSPEVRFEGLNIGAEDYITKPFDLRELTIRLDRIIENKGISSPLYTVNGYEFEFNNYQIKCPEDRYLALNQKECLILKLLVDNKGNVVSRDSIIEHVWGEESFPTNRTVDNYIVKIRKLIEEINTIQISSIRGVGYRFEEVEE